MVTYSTGNHSTVKNTVRLISDYIVNNSLRNSSGPCLLNN